jgi:hypothetical protein
MPATKRRGVTDVESQRLNVRLDPAAYQRLMIHCVMGGIQPGKFIENLINTHCRDWRVQANRVTPIDRLDLDASVSQGEIAAA